MSGTDDGFLSRWSRRKQESRDSPPEAETPEPSPVADTGDVEPPLDLPDIDSLDKDSDYSVFMREGVPEALQNLALRKLWRSDPIFASLDGLNDYDEDFRTALAVGAEAMRKFREAEALLAESAEDETGDDAPTRMAAADTAGTEKESDDTAKKDESSDDDVGDAES